MLAADDEICSSSSSESIPASRYITHLQQQKQRWRANEIQFPAVVWCARALNYTYACMHAAQERAAAAGAAPAAARGTLSPARVLHLDARLVSFIFCSSKLLAIRKQAEFASSSFRCARLMQLRIPSSSSSWLFLACGLFFVFRVVSFLSLFALTLSVYSFLCFFFFLFFFCLSLENILSFFTARFFRGSSLFFNPPL